jgi:hypothetical protein
MPWSNDPVPSIISIFYDAPTLHNWREIMTFGITKEEGDSFDKDIFVSFGDEVRIW